MAPARAKKKIHLLAGVYSHGRGNVSVLYETRDALGTTVQLQLTEARLGSKDPAELRLADRVSQVANEQCVTGWVVLGVGDISICARAA